MNKVIIMLAMLAVSFALSARKYSVKEVPNVQLQDSLRLFSNPDGIVDADTESAVNAKLVDLRRNSSAEVAVVVVDDINSDDIDLFATDLFTRWGIGKKGADNGVLFLVAKNCSKMVIRTGYGAEGALPDIICNRIIKDDVAPKFKDGDYSGGVLAGVDRICHFMNNPTDRAKTIEQEKAEKAAERRGLVGALIGVGSLLGLTGVALAGRKGYKKYRRNKPRPCKKCGTMMVKQSEERDNDYLTEQRDFEEQIGSVDYDVWVCPSCNEVEIEAYPGKSGAYMMCPRCHTKAMKRSAEQIVDKPTQFQKGLARRYYNCKHCGFHKVENIVLPLVAAAPLVGGRGSGGFGGGGGSFGGGMTGGGGASGGW